MAVLWTSVTTENCPAYKILNASTFPSQTYAFSLLLAHLYSDYGNSLTCSSLLIAVLQPFPVFISLLAWRRLQSKLPGTSLMPL